MRRPGAHHGHPSLPGLLERTATLIDASGIVLWIADPDGRELAPIVTFGYPQQTVTRLGTIAREAENATAAAFRTCLLQTVDADEVSAARSPRRWSRRRGASA